MKRFLVVAMIIFGIVVFPSSAEAVKNTDADGEKNHHKTFLIDGKKYTKDQLIHDFMKAAFSSHLWYEEVPLEANQGWFMSGPAIRKELGSGSDLKDAAPWAYKYFSFDRTYPRFDSINKWDKTLTIGLGWPPILEKKNGNVAIYNDQTSAGTPDLQKTILDQITLIKSDIEDMTGLTVNIINRNDETAESYASLRILAYPVFTPLNKFKSDRIMKEVGQAQNDAIRVRIFEPNISTAVRFTPFARAQVEGYYIPTANNQIDFSVCQLWPGLKEDVMRPLLIECVLRSLGMPEMAPNKQSYLGEWNYLNNPYSKRDILDASENVISSYAMLTVLEAMAKHTGDASFTQKVKTAKESDQTFHGVPPVSLPKKLTEYDKAMMSILYCPTIKTGMGRFEVLEVLDSNEQCFSKIGSSVIIR